MSANPGQPEVELELETEIEIELHIPEEVRYSCQGCGRCCSGWSVGMTEEDYANVKNTDWAALHPALADKELFFHREQEFLDGTAVYPHYTKPTAAGSCPFLIDNLCFIHGQLGEDKKPISCRIFPYTFAQTPTGVYAGVVFTSMAAVRNIGAPLSEQREKLTEHFNLTLQHKNEVMKPEAKAAHEEVLAAIAAGATAVYKNPFETVSLTPACQVTWAEYLLIEERMIALVQARMRLADENPQDCSILKTLLLCSEILMHGRKLKLSNGNIADIKDFEPNLKTPVDITPSGIELMTLRMLFYRFFVYPTVRVSDSRLWQMQKSKAFQGNNAMVVVNTFSKFAGSGIRTILFGDAGLPLLGPIKLDKALAADFKCLDAESNRLFHRWIYLKLFSKAYFGPAAAGFSALSGFNCLIAGVLSVLIYAKSAALNRKENSISMPDIYESYWLLDRELLTIGQIPEQESRMYNSGLSAPRLFNKALWAMSKAFGDQIG